MPTSTLTSKGQTTIPKKIRDELGLKPGDKLEFYLEEEGRVVLRPATRDVRELKGILQRDDGPVLSVEQMNEAIVAGATSEDT